MKSATKLSIILLVILIASSLVSAQTYEPTWNSLDSRPIPKWFTDAKFGIFIHWGVYSVPAWRPLSSKLYASYAEWYYAKVIGDKQFGGDIFHKTVYGENFGYRDFAPMFKAELFDPDFWAGLFKRAGAKYVVLTSKHHDGFCLWPTRSPFKKSWNSMDVGPKRDLLGDLTKAVRAKGLRMGIYYSLIEWESSRTHRTETGYYIDKKLVEKYRIPEDKYVTEHILPQLKELVTQYQPAVIFSDGGEWDGSEEYWHTKEFLAWLYNQAPNRDEVVVNDRWAKGMPGKHGDYFSSEYKDTDAVGQEHPWEESRGVGGSYGFNRAENLDDYSSSKELIHELIDIVSRGGNLLLNIGPTADGRIPVIMQQRLVDIGHWLSINGEAIYGTRTLADQSIRLERENDGCFFTTKGKNLYLLCVDWPTQAITILGLKNREGINVRLLGAKKRVRWKSSGGKITFKPPVILPDEIPDANAYVFKIENSL